jgi:hypothetical protein
MINFFTQIFRRDIQSSETITPSSDFSKYIGPTPTSQANFSISLSNTFNSSDPDKMRRLICRYFTEGLPYLQRRKIREKLAIDIMEGLINPDFQENWNQFALSECASIIVRTPYEGGPLLTSISDAVNYFDFYSTKSSFFDVTLPSGLSQHKLYTSIRESLCIMKSFVKLELPHSDDPTPDKIVEAKAKEWLEKIREYLLSRNTLYLPYSYRAGPKNQGHAVVIKVTRNDSKTIFVQLLNVGNGADLHVDLDYSLYEKRKSFAHIPIPFDESDFFGNDGEFFFGQLLRYNADAPIDSAYDGYDIYDIFCLFLIRNRSPIPIYDPSVDEYGAELQVAGNCSYKAIENTRRDLLNGFQVPSISIKKIDLNIRFANIINHFKALERDRKGDFKKVLMNSAIKSFSRSVVELYHLNHISQRELVGTVAVLRYISKKLKQHSLSAN